jgi:hypothetical protein
MSVFDDVGNFISDTGRDVAGLVSDAASSVWTAADDAVSGWEELFTGDRRAKVEHTQRRLEYMVADLTATKDLFHDLAQTHGEVVAALSEVTASMHATFSPDEHGTVYDIAEVSKNVLFLAGGVSGVVAGGTQMVALGSQLWTACVGGSTAVEATGVEAAIATTVAEGGVVAADLAGTGLASSAAAVSSFAGTLGVACVAVTAVALILQTVLQGVQVAALRQALRDLEDKTREFTSKLPILEKMLNDLKESLGELYVKLGRPEAGKHVIVAPDGAKVVVEDFLDRIGRITAVIEAQDCESKDNFTQLQAQIQAENAVIHLALVKPMLDWSASIKKLDADVLAAAELMRQGTALDTIRQVYQLDPALLQKIQQFVLASADRPEAKPRLRLLQDGEVEVVAA